MKFRLPFVLPILIAVTFAVAAPDEEPAPELTEYWQPVPPAIAAPAGGVPSDATVLFDGTSLAAWAPDESGSAGWKIEDGAMVVVPHAGGIHTREAFGDVQLHLEWREPPDVAGESQARGNSGVFFMGLYELQVLDSYKNKTYVNGQAGSIYKQHPPLVNPTRPPGEWQTYDVVFIAPRFTADGKVASPARMTVFFNGVLVQHDAVLRGPTRWRGEPVYHAHAARLPLALQDHGNPVAFRNIWVRPLALPGRAQ
jgi:hypothetical protein